MSTWAQLDYKQLVTRAALQDAVNTGVFSLKAGQSIPGTDVDKCVSAAEAVTWVNFDTSAMPNNGRLPYKIDFLPGIDPGDYMPILVSVNNLPNLTIYGVKTYPDNQELVPGIGDIFIQPDHSDEYGRTKVIPAQTIYVLTNYFDGSGNHTSVTPGTTIMLIKNDIEINAVYVTQGITSTSSIPVYIDLTENIYASDSLKIEVLITSPG